MKQYSESPRKYFERSVPVNNLPLQRLALASVSVLAISTISTQSMAQCEPDPPEDGDEVVCEGVDDDGFQAFAPNIRFIVENDGSIIVDGERAVRIFSPGGTFANFGVIEGTSTIGDPLVELQGSSLAPPLTGSNHGIIHSGPLFGSALVLFSGVSDFENAVGATISVDAEGQFDSSAAVVLDQSFRGAFTNSGSISSNTLVALSVPTFSQITEQRDVEIINTETGTIISENGVAAAIGAAQFSNSGLVRGVVGVEAYAFSTFINEEIGIVESISPVSTSIFESFSVVANSATIINYGTIFGGPQSIRGNNSIIENHGEIIGDLLLTQVHIMNTGLIDGSIFSEFGGLEIENVGEILGDIISGTGSSVFVDQIDVFRNVGGTITGRVDLGPGDDFVLATQDADRGVIQGGIDAGDGLDSFGYSVTGIEDVSLELEPGFEGHAVESRYDESVANIISTDTTLDHTLSLFGNGTIVNGADINVSNGDAVRLLSRVADFCCSQPEPLFRNPFGEGVTFINNAVISSNAGAAITTLPTSPDGSGPIGNERIENRNTINGDVFLGAGDDILINRGIVNGAIHLGIGDDFFLTDINAVGPMHGPLFVDDGCCSAIDSIGIYTDQNASATIGVSGDFNSAGVFVDGENTVLTITGITPGEELPMLRVLGNGSVVNNAPVVAPGISRNEIGIELLSNGLQFTNNASITAGTSIQLGGDHQTVVNNADFAGDNFARFDEVFLRDLGAGNTIINNADLSFARIEVGQIFNGRLIEELVLSGANLPESSIINNGDVNFVGITSELPVSLQNFGEINTVLANPQLGGVRIENLDGGTIRSVTIFAEFAESGFLLSEPIITATLINRSGGLIGPSDDNFFAPAAIEIFSGSDADNSVPMINFFIDNEEGAIISGGSRSAIDYVTTFSDDRLGLFINNNGDIISESTDPTIMGRDFVLSEGEGVAIHNNGIIRNALVDGESIAIQTETTDDLIVNSGEIFGNVLLGGGNDSFTVVFGSRIVGSVDGGAEFDILSFDNISGDLLVSQFNDFERLDISTNTVAVINDSADLSTSFTELVLREGLTRLETELSLDAIILEKGILGGNGIIVGNVTNFGTIAPGASIGEMTINGDLTLATNSVLNIEFDDSESDVLTVLGGVSIDDATLEFTSLGANLSSVHSFEFLTANSVSGQFSDISFNGFTGFADLVFANGVLGVTITPQFEFSPSLTANSVSVAGYLNDLIVADAVNTSAEKIVSTLFSLSANNAALNAAMLSLQPEAFAATAAISVEKVVLINDVIRDRTKIDNYREDGKYFWLSGAGGFANYEGDLGGDGTSSFTTNSRSVIGGAEIVRGDALIGIYGGKVESEQDLRTGLSQTEADGFVTGGYGAWRIGEFSNMASIGYVFGEAETVRDIPALSEQLQSDYDLDSFTAQARSQYDFTVNGLLLSPYAGATFVRSDRGVVVETGGASALHVSDQSESFLFLDVGSAIEKQFSINDRTKARAAFSAGWRYEALGHSIDAYSSIGMDGPFNLAGAAAEFDRSRLIVGGDGSVDIGENIFVFASYRGEFGGDYTSNRVSGGLAVRF